MERSIGDEFHKAIQFLHDLPASFPRYAACECLERRHGFMRGSIIVLDVTVPGLAYPARRASPMAVTSGFRAESAHKIDDNTYQQDQAKSSSADGRPAKIKTAAAEQEKKNKDQK